MKRNYFEDLSIGWSARGAEVVVERDEMLRFAAQYDPQPMHLSDAGAQAIGLSRTIASGAYTFALSSASMQPIVGQLAFLPGGLGFEMSFTAPVFAGDRLRLISEIIGLRRSSKSARGWANMHSPFLNEDDAVVLEIKNFWFIACRPGD
ncbi:MAG: MaoC/PaaZ C-terminal domain-containing protein [Pseudomonadota bacterium]